MSVVLDITRRFNKMSIKAKQGLAGLIKAYADQNLYMYDYDALSSLFGAGKSEVKGITSELRSHGFLYEHKMGYRLNRQKADTLITMGILDLEGDELPPMGPANDKPEGFMESINEQDMRIMRRYGLESPKNPTSLSTSDFQITVDEPEKNTRFRVIEIIDMSAAGRKIEPPMWSVSDSKSQKIYLVAQTGLKFKDPDASMYVGLKQIEFLKQHPQYVLGVFADSDMGQEKAREHASKFFDTSVNNRNISGFLPHRVGNKFWVLQSAADGSYTVLKRGKLPPYTPDRNKVDDLTHDEAVGVFAASEKKWEDSKIDPQNDIDHKYASDVDVAGAVDGFFNLGQFGK